MYLKKNKIKFNWKLIQILFTKIKLYLSKFDQINKIQLNLTTHKCPTRYLAGLGTK